MRGTFVVRLGAETEPEQTHFEGFVEEVDSGMELRFRSTDQLLQFLAKRFQAAFGSSSQEAKQNEAADDGTQI